MRALLESEALGWRVWVRFALALAVLLWMDRYGAEALQQAVLPGVRLVMQLWSDTYRIEDIGLFRVGADRVVGVNVSLARCVVMEGLAVCPGAHKGFAQASTLAGSVDLVLILMGAGVLSWPVRRRREYIWRLAACVPVVMLIWSLDVPLILLGAIWSLHHDAYVPTSWSPLLAWVDFMKNGGRLALSGLGVGTVIVWAQWMSRLDG